MELAPALARGLSVRYGGTVAVHTPVPQTEVFAVGVLLALPSLLLVARRRPRYAVAG
ncbi:hypothetical protein [Blastococcus sp. SYSU DS0973]